MSYKFGSKIHRAVKYDKPTKSISKGIKQKKEREAYNKLTDNEKLEYDLKKDEENEVNLKGVIRGKGYKYKKLSNYINEIVGKYNPKIVRIKNLKDGNKDLISIRIDENKFEKENKSFTVKKIKQISDLLSNFLEENKVSGKQMTALRYGDLGWKSGYLRTFGEDTKLYDPNQLYNMEVPYEQPKSIQSFNIYLALGNRAVGGDDDKFNDCLYNCLKYFIFNIENYFKSSCEFKKWLGLKRSDKVPLSLIDKVEMKLKNYQINIRGDFIRSSTVKSLKQINLILSNEHYTVEKVERKLTPFIKYEEKLPIMYDKKTFEGFDGIKKWVLTKEERNNILYNPKSPYILVNREEQGRDDNDNRIVITIEEEYKQFIINADILKIESKGLINLYKSGSYYNAGLSLFDRLTKFMNPEPLLQDEAIWIKNSSFGAIIWCEQYEGPLYKYDVKSLYPYIMKSSSLRFPIKRGEFRNIKEFNKDYYEFGIYRCEISKSEDDNINKLFKFNFHNLYSSVDLMNATQLNLNVELIQDDKPNFLYYSTDKTIKFCEIFTDYVDILFPLKENKIQKSKNILNILWGALCEIDKKKQYVQTDFEIDDDDEILEIYPSSDDTSHIIKTTKMNHYYKTPFARLCPFLLSQGRRHMTTILLDIKDNIHRIQTDGFLTDKPLHSITNVKLGELKFEGFTDNGIIKNCINRVNTKV